MATKTGNRYTTGTTTDSVKIPMASPGFSTMTSWNKVLLHDCDSDRQLEMAVWPPKPEILISLELWLMGWQFQRQIWDFHPRPAQRNWSQVIATTNDNQKLQYIHFGHQSCNFCNHLTNLSNLISSSSSLIIWNLALEFWWYLHSSRDVIISIFGGRIDVSGVTTTDFVCLPRKHRCKLYRCNIFECWRLKMTAQSIDNSSYTFSRWQTIPEVVIGHHLQHIAGCREM